MPYAPERHGFNSARFADAMRASRYTQDQVAVASGVSAWAISNWAQGKTVPQLPKLARVAQFLNVSPDAFFDRDEER